MSSRQVDGYEVHIVDGYAELPMGVKVINMYALKDCTSLTSVRIPFSVQRIGECAFKGCTSLTSVIIPSSVTEISVCSFKDCTSLTSITICTPCRIVDGTFDAVVTIIRLPQNRMDACYRLASTMRRLRALKFWKPLLLAWVERTALKYGWYAPEGAGRKRDRDAFERDFGVA